MITPLRAVLLSFVLTSCAAQSKRPELNQVPTHTTANKKTKAQTNKKASAAAAQAPNTAQINSTLVSSSPIVTSAPVPASVTQKAHQLEVEKKYLEALKLFIEQANTSTVKSEQDSAKIKAIEITENKLDQEQLKQVANDSNFGVVRASAYAKLGEAALDEHNKDDARKYFSAVTQLAPGTELATHAQEILSQLEAAKYVETKTIGVVLPLSGKNAPIGQRALRGIELGLGVNTPGSTFKLAVMDSEGNPDKARRGVERLVKEDNVIAIVGSLLSKTAPAVAAKADELGVPTIALSQKSGLTDVGPNVFRNALTAEMQIRFLVRVAMEDMGMKRFAIMYPNDPYGIEYANIFWDEVLARGGSITAVQTYGNKETDFRYPIQRLVGKFYIEARADEYKQRSKDLFNPDNKKKLVRHSVSSDDILPPVVNFDAVFVPDSAKALGQISAMLAYNDVRGVKLLGTNLWNTKDIVRRAGNAASNLIFVDSYNDTAATEKSKFYADYRAIFNEEPSLIEVQSFDSALILRQLIVGGASSREELLRRLNSLKNLPGAVGPISMGTEREIERPLMALTVDKGEIIPLKASK